MLAYVRCHFQYISCQYVYFCHFCCYYHVGYLFYLHDITMLLMVYSLLHLITMTSQWPRWRLKSPASRLFTQQFIQTQIKGNIKAPRHWPLCGEFTGTGEFPAQRASNAENVSIWWRHHVQKRACYWLLIDMALCVNLIKLITGHGDGLGPA